MKRCPSCGRFVSDKKMQLRVPVGMTVTFAKVTVPGPAIVLPCSRCNAFFTAVGLGMEWAELNMDDEEPSAVSLASPSAAP